MWLTLYAQIGLSGTLLQNDLIELWALLDLISSSTWINHKEMRVKVPFPPSYRVLSPPQFEMPIRLGQKQNASRSELARRRVAMKKLATELKKFVLRRDKTILGDSLPGKTDQIVYALHASAYPYASLTRLQIHVAHAAAKRGLPELHRAARSEGTLALLVALSVRFAQGPWQLLREDPRGTRNRRNAAVGDRYEPNCLLRRR